MTVTSVVGVPHPARTADELRAAVAVGDGVVLDPYDHDPALRVAFAAAGQGRMAEADLDAVDRHGTCAYLVIEDGGSIDAATRLVRAAREVLLAGGLAVKVESAGVAHPAAGWLALGADPGPGDLVEAFVASVLTPAGGVRSCGMHNLGLPDVRTPPGGEPGLAQVFCTFQAMDRPVLADGQTFGLGPDAPGYRLRLGEDGSAPPGDLFHNPFGVWTLDPLSRSEGV